MVSELTVFRLHSNHSWGWKTFFFIKVPRPPQKHFHNSTHHAASHCRLFVDEPQGKLLQSHMTGMHLFFFIGHCGLWGGDIASIFLSVHSCKATLRDGVGVDYCTRHHWYLAHSSFGFVLFSIYARFFFFCKSTNSAFIDNLESIQTFLGTGLYSKDAMGPGVKLRSVNKFPCVSQRECKK